MLLPVVSPHPHVIVCAARDEPALWRQLHRLRSLGVPLCPFFEPDRADELTAVAAGPAQGGGRKAFRNLRLLAPKMGGAP